MFIILQQNVGRIKVEDETGMVSEEDPRCIDNDDTDIIPSAFSVQETVPEVSLIFYLFTSIYKYYHHHHHHQCNSSSSSHGHVCVFFFPTALTTHTHNYVNVTSSLKNAHDNFDGMVRIFELLKHLQRYVINAAL